MYAFDFTNLLAAAVDRANGQRGAPLLAALDQVSVESANGDSRGFNATATRASSTTTSTSRTSPARRSRPVTDDPLSRTLPAIVQTP